MGAQWGFKFHLSSCGLGAEVHSRGDQLWRPCDRWLGPPLHPKHLGGFLLSCCAGTRTHLLSLWRVQADQHRPGREGEVPGLSCSVSLSLSYCTFEQLLFWWLSIGVPGVYSWPAHQRRARDLWAPWQCQHQLCPERGIHPAWCCGATSAQGCS